MGCCDAMCFWECDGACSGEVRPVYREARPAWSFSVHACAAHRALALEEMEAKGGKATRSCWASDAERRATVGGA